MEFIYSRNDALEVNPQGGQSHLSEGGSDWLFAVMACFALTFLAYYVLSFRPRHGEKIFHYLFTIALLVGAISYFAMASGLAYSVIPTHLYTRDAATYQIFFAKYIFWVVAFPVIIIALGLVSGVSWATILFNIFLAWIWIISYLCSAYTATRYKWGFYTFGTIAYLLLAFQTIWASRSSADRVQLLYPIAFAVSDGGNVIGVTQGLIFFGILDLLLVCGTAFAFLFLARKWDYGGLNLQFTQYGRVRSNRNDVHPEKGHVGTHAPAGTTTASPATYGGVNPPV
ncbi:hypothetical protein IWW34DRAFT_873233 [Fusarium oxysporum f. sp. albedinis]|nr:hypothetical protein IWW34DRAFT_873233 [Fusarium oxysporum f. sp. albedinis]KAK2470454.1 hypothetical protein H9L39_18071 [Fusarium oxysporum f. sp. albedinis]